MLALITMIALIVAAFAITHWAGRVADAREEAELQRRQRHAACLAEQIRIDQIAERMEEK